MNIFDKDDKKIEAILKANIYEPDSYTDAIMTALKKKDKRVIISLPKLIATLIATAMLISGAVYAKQIGEFIRRIFNENKGTDVAVEYGYIEEINQEFDTNSETKIKLNSLLMDDYNINFTININFIEKYKKCISLNIPDMIITDESNNILFCIEKDTFQRYCEKNELSLDYHNAYDKYLNTTKYIHQTYDEKEISFNIKSTEPYPLSKKIYIEFNNIVVTMEDKTTRTITGEWKIEIDAIGLLEKRKTKEYKIIETNEISLKDFKFETYNTGTVIEFCVKPTEQITTDIPEKSIENTFLDFGFDVTQRGCKNIKIINSYGDVFTSANSNFDDETERLEIDGTLHYKNTLDLTQYDLTDALTLYFTIHAINEDKDVVIKLKQVDN